MYLYRRYGTTKRITMLYHKKIAIYMFINQVDRSIKMHAFLEGRIR